MFNNNNNNSTISNHNSNINNNYVLALAKCVPILRLKNNRSK